MMNGWIKLMRQMMNWEWYDDAYMVKFFIHLLLSANHKDGKWKGYPVKRGQLITGLNSLSKSANMTVQKVRTCLKRLQSSGEIIVISTNRFSTITICNYDDYQVKESDINKQTTNKQQTNNNKQEGKEDKEKKDRGFKLFWDYYHEVSGLAKTDKKATEKYWYKLTLDDMRLAYDKIDLYIASVSDKKYIKKARTYLADENFNDEFNKTEDRGLVR